MTKQTTPKAEKPALRHAVSENAKPTTEEIADVAKAEAEKAAAAEAAESEKVLNEYGLPVGEILTFEQVQAFYRARRELGRDIETDEEVERVRASKRK